MKKNLVEAAAQLISQRFGHLKEESEPVHDTTTGTAQRVPGGIQVTNGPYDHTFTDKDIAKMDRGGKSKYGFSRSRKERHGDDNADDDPEAQSAYYSDAHGEAYTIPNHLKR